MAEETNQDPFEGDAAREDGRNGRQQRKRDETPVEDLFDLSKPIPKVRDS